MIGPINLAHVAPSKNIHEAAAVSAQTAIQKAAQEINVSGVKPMFATAAILAPLAINMNRLADEQNKASEASANQKAEGPQKQRNNLPEGMLPCRQFMAQLQNMQSKMGDLKAKGLAMGTNPDLKDVGFASLPEAANINIYSR